jgi:hypothetical protein
LVALIQQFVDPLSGQQFSDDDESEPATAFDDREKFQISDFQFSIFNPGTLAARVQLRRLQRLRIGDVQNLRRAPANAPVLSALRCELQCSGSSLRPWKVSD